MAKKKKSKYGKQAFAIFMFLVFLVSTFGFALLYSTGTSQSGANSQVQPVLQNIFTSPLDFQTRNTIVTPLNPQQYPQFPPERVFGGVLIEYSCENCTELVENLTNLANKYNPRIYIAPSNRNETLFLLSYGGSSSLEEFNETAIEDYICTSLVLPPDICALRGI